LIETRQMKTLRPNAVAARERRLFGKFRVLFDVDEQAQAVRSLEARLREPSVLAREALNRLSRDR